MSDAPRHSALWGTKSLRRCGMKPPMLPRDSPWSIFVVPRFKWFLDRPLFRFWSRFQRRWTLYQPKLLSSALPLWPLLVSFHWSVNFLSFCRWSLCVFSVVYDAFAWDRSVWPCGFWGLSLIRFNCCCVVGPHIFFALLCLFPFIQSLLVFFWVPILFFMISEFFMINLRPSRMWSYTSHEHIKFELVVSRFGQTIYFFDNRFLRIRFNLSLIFIVSVVELSSTWQSPSRLLRVSSHLVSLRCSLLLRSSSPRFSLPRTPAFDVVLYHNTYFIQSDDWITTCVIVRSNSTINCWETVEKSLEPLIFLHSGSSFDLFHYPAVSILMITSTYLSMTISRLQWNSVFAMTKYSFNFSVFLITFLQAPHSSLF